MFKTKGNCTFGMGGLPIMMTFVILIFGIVIIGFGMMIFNFGMMMLDLAN